MRSAKDLCVRKCDWFWRAGTGEKPLRSFTTKRAGTAISRSGRPTWGAVMRQRMDYYTICPECESRVAVTHPARLQAGRNGTSCVCVSPHCSHEWICIQEWIYRNSLVTPRAIVAAPAPAPLMHPGGGMAPPRPHLPTFQPPQSMPGSVPATADAPAQSVPAPHAWSWERINKSHQVARPDQNAFGS